MKERKHSFPTTNDLRTRFRDIHAICAATIDQSFEGARSNIMATSLQFANDLADWSALVAPAAESQLYSRAEQEYIGALINVAQGQYSNAFKGLRITLELTIQGIYLSANLVELHEWLQNSRDTKWATLMDPEHGPFSTRFADAFFPDIKEHVGTFATMARTLYRELSETIHGNIPKLIPFPPSFSFDEETFDLWHRKAATVRITSLFDLSLRYLRTLSDEDRSTIEHSVTEQLGYIEAVRTLFGGPSTL